VCYHNYQHLLGWQGLILTLGCQHGLNEEMYLIDELLKVLLGRNVRGNM
jgi:hypothetical protein